MSDEEVKTVEATETEAKTEDKKDTRSYRAKAVFAKRRVEEKKEKKEEKKTEAESSEGTAKPSSSKLAHTVVGIATAATVSMGLAPNAASAATPGDYNKERSTQLAKDLNYEYADNKDMHFKPLTESEAAMLEASLCGGNSKTASFTRARQEMNAQTTRTATTQTTRTAATRTAGDENVYCYYKGEPLVFCPELSADLNLDRYKACCLSLNELTAYAEGRIESDRMHAFYIPSGIGTVERCSFDNAVKCFEHGSGNVRYICDHPRYKFPGFGRYIPGGGRVRGGHVNVSHRNGQTTVSVGGSGRRGAGGVTISTGRRGTSVSIGGFTIGD